MATPQRDTLGLAFLGLGSYVENQLIPALAAARHLRLAGAITSDPDDARRLLNAHGAPDARVYHYDDIDQLATDDAIDIVYIVTPNSLHEDHCLRVANAGKHIICEKPLATTVQACQRIQEAVDRNGIRFSMGYRMHFEPLTRELVRSLRSGRYGKILRVEAAFADASKEAGEWRLDADMAGGGPLMDLGIYCLNAACYVTGADPLSVAAIEGEVIDQERLGDPDVEQQISFELFFPGDVSARCRTSYAHEEDYLRVYTETGTLIMEPAFDYQTQRLFLPDGNEVPKPNDFQEQTGQLDDFARAILDGRPTPVPVEMGLRDLLIIETIYEAADLGERLEIPYPDNWTVVGERMFAPEIGTEIIGEAPDEDDANLRQAA